MDAQLQQLINLQTEQVELLKKYLWRLRFSLLTLLLLTTGSCIALGYMAITNRASSVPVPVYIQPTGIRPVPAGVQPPPSIQPPIYTGPPVSNIK
jgi:hypothetical protein